jgi:tricorn protease
MTRHCHFALAFLASLVLGASIPAQEPIRFARTPDISPDGKLVAFSYLGDVWMSGPLAASRPVTMHRARHQPIFSPDGGPASRPTAGAATTSSLSPSTAARKQLTFDSASDLVCGWARTAVHLFTSTRSTAPAAPSWRVPSEAAAAGAITAARAKRTLRAQASNHYVRSKGRWYRKGYRGSSSDDVWLCRRRTNNRQLTTFNGQDSSPMWGPGEQTSTTSAVHGTPANVVRQASVGREALAGDVPKGRGRPQHQPQRRMDRVRMRPRSVGRLDARGGIRAQLPSRFTP